MGGQKGPIWPKTGPNREKSSEGQIWGQTCSQLPLIGPTGLESWLPHTLAWYRASSGPQGTPKGPILAENAPFGGSGGTPRAPGGHTWSQLPPIGLTGLESWLPHHLAWYWAFYWPQGAQNGPVLALNTHFGGPGGTQRARRDQIWSQRPRAAAPRLDSWLPETSAWYRASSWQPGALQGPFLL